MSRDHRLYCCDSPAHICAQFQGQVFQLPAGTALAPGQFLLSEGQGADGPVLRVLCDTPPTSGIPVTPGLEDAFSRHLPGGAAMNLAVYEWRKLFRLPALWTFLALCLAFNALLIAGLSPYDRTFFNETSQTAKALGQRVDRRFFGRSGRYARHGEPGPAAPVRHRDGGHL